MKKLLILCMTCNDPFFVEQEKVIKETWGKPIIEGKYPNVNIVFYTGSTLETHSYAKADHKLYLRCEDDANNTYKKTYYALNVIEHNWDYDYVFRTNTSTFVNVDLLNYFVQHVEDDSVLWCSELYSLSEVNAPYPLNIFGRGNGLLLSRKLIDIILKEGINFVYMGLCDDWVMGNILNSYWLKQDEDYMKHIKSLTHGWWKCINCTCNNNHSLCAYENENADFNFLKQFITIQIKRYREREIENNNYYELWDIFSKNKDKHLKKSNDFIYEYAKNPNVFVGSILGYITLAQWLVFDKAKLYEIEMNNKASDDEQRYKEHHIPL